MRFLLILLLALVAGSLVNAASFALLPGYQMRYSAPLSSIVASPRGETFNQSEYLVKIFVEEDNQDLSLPSSFRRWWHLKIEGLKCADGCVLNVEVHNAMYSDVILPVWSLDGGETYTRCPSSALPSYSGGIHRFVLNEIPANTTSLHLSKFFPYPIPHFEEFRERVLQSDRVQETQIGASELGYPMYVWEIAKESTLRRVGAPRIYVQAGIHPSETTSYFVNEGFLNWVLFSNDPRVEDLLDQVILSVVPMCNPDGVALGNYRTNANSVNLEVEYEAPYDSSVKESVAIRTLVERYMGTSESPGDHPILVLMNLHSTHGDYMPFHFLHQPYYNINQTGVIPEVRALEDLWEKGYKRVSEFIDNGNGQFSTFSVREYIESMIHDRWTLDVDYPAPITMAITMEGVYQRNPQGGCCNTIGDYNTLGVELGEAMLEYLAALLDGRAL